MKTLLILTLLVLSAIASAGQRIYIQFDDYCDTYELDLNENGTITGGEVGCSDYKLVYVTGAYGLLGEGYTKDNLIILLTFNSGDKTYIESLNPITGNSTFYAGGNKTPLITTTYTLSNTLGGSETSRVSADPQEQ